MDKNKNYQQLKEFSLGQGLDLFGTADISAIKNDFMLSPKALEGIDGAISLGLRLSASILREIADAPTRLYFHHYRTANVLLDQAAFKISSFIQRKGYSAIPIPASQIVDWQNQKAHLSHRKIAFLAGLGWIGRNNLLVNKGFGCQLRLASILTNMPLSMDKPTEQNCDKCFACIKVCPAQAIKESNQEFEYMKCFEKLKEFQRLRLVDQFICGVCVNTCSGEERRIK